MAQFPLLLNGVEVCNLENLRDNFCPDQLLSYRKRFAAWLRGWDYDEEAVEVKALVPELSDKEWLLSVGKIIGIPECEVETAWEELQSRSQPEIETPCPDEEKNQKQNKVEQQQRANTNPIPEKVRISSISGWHSCSCVAYSDGTILALLGTIYEHRLELLKFEDSSFTRINPRGAKKKTPYEDCFCVNDWLVCGDRKAQYCSKDGLTWDTCSSKFIPSHIVYDKLNERYVHLNFMSFEDYRFHFSSSLSLTGEWNGFMGEIDRSHGQLPVNLNAWGWRFDGFYCHNGEFFINAKNEISYDIFCPRRRFLFYSKNGVTWKIAEDKDKDWLDGQTIFEDDFKKIYVKFKYFSIAHLKTGYSLDIIESYKDVVWNGITLSIDTNDAYNIIVQKECCQSKIIRFDREIKQIICKNDVLFIFSKEGEFQKAKIELLPEHYTAFAGE